jgi:hypothetical protein
MKRERTDEIIILLDHEYVSTLSSVYNINSNNKINKDTLAIIATKVVTIVGIASYTSGLQKWNGAAAILNNKPIEIIVKGNCIYVYCI